MLGRLKYGSVTSSDVSGGLIWCQLVLLIQLTSSPEDEKMWSHTGFSASHATSMPCCQLHRVSAHALERSPVRDPAQVLCRVYLVRDVDPTVGAGARDGIREEAGVNSTPRCDRFALPMRGRTAARRRRPPRPP